MILGLITLGILPSLVWLSIYLKEDDHPEPNRFIIRIFFLGALAAPLAAGVEFLLIGSIKELAWPAVLVNFLIFFVFIGMVEEYCKYLAVRVGVERKSVFDEPTDAMIYLIVSGLGFAALENVLALFHFTDRAATDVAGQAFEITALRFLSSTLLHVLASAIVGYYLARSHFFREKLSVLKGIVTAGFLHGGYNVLTLNSGSFQKIGATLMVVFLLSVMAIFVNFLFYKLKREYFR
ncbi:MAG: PrsW family intramembrane metalloprotease [Candidatus Sungbacteria bacterium]|uniref:Protease PrsW n=1 Tax=Candidatus Sungiibacteriota bacterium TaxID=2750080 RepID=A0A932DSG8_9BACT|nr:PrsW family intramembrane metalloprotease [Candidatus Sungbacteria bacterium]